MCSTRLLFLIAAFLPVSLLAQAPNPNVDLIVTGAICQSRDLIGHDRKCRLGDTVVVKFSNLDDWNKSDPAAHNPSKLVLALDGHPLTGVHANAEVVGSNQLSFDLTNPEGDTAGTDANSQAWRAILRSRHAVAILPVSVGISGGEVFYGSDNAKITYQVYPPSTIPVFGTVVIFIVAVCFLAWRTNMIRAPGPDPAIGLRPYSLSRTQMVWWFLMVSASYLYIWLITDNQDTLTTGVLILTGISAATGLSSAVLSGSPAAPAAAAQVEGTPPPAPAPPPAVASRGFWADILGDQTGISFDRLQMAAWTVILGIVFAREVLRDLSMPDFSPTLLGLMGISSGTYVGFKLPGSKS
jgi:hypothetical protein